jgi:hypothetical protein
MKLIHSTPPDTESVTTDTKGQLIKILQKVNMEKYLFRPPAFFKEACINDEEKLYDYFYPESSDLEEVAKLKGAFNIWGDLCKSDRMSVITEFSRIAEIKGFTLSRRQRSLMFCHIFIDNFLVVLVRR